MPERDLEQIEDELIDMVQERLGDIELTAQRILVHVSEIHDEPTLRLRANGQHHDLGRAAVPEIEDLEALADKIAADLMY